MEQRRAIAYEEVEPVVEWRQVGDDRDVVEISLPGFRKEQVRVQVDNHGVLRATGERPAAARGGRWVRFKKDLRLPENCDADGVRARFEDHKLIITLPLVVPDTRKEVQEVARVGAPAAEEKETKEQPPPSTASGTRTEAENERRLLVNMAAAAAVLVGIVVAVWRTLSS
uniref:SHSP domain-containing protein n=1 Tax=Oryza brachyantha TaxID=4533 RepID=J3NF57_ORYBR